MEEAFNWPRVIGHTFVAGHRCPHCAGPVRATYRLTPGAAISNSPLGSSYDWMAFPFPGGLVAVHQSHRSSAHVTWVPPGICPWTIPSISSADATNTSFIQHLYDYIAGGRAPNRIIRFDPAAFLGQPWVLWTKASGEPPIALIPTPVHLRHHLVHGTMPRAGATVTLDKADVPVACAAFCAAIGAVTGPLAI